MEEKLRAVIAAHNRMIETIQNAEMTCNLFRGMEVWHKIACEGAEIVSAARAIGIDAKVNMQSGVIYAQEGSPETLPDAYPELAMYDAEDYRCDLTRDDPEPEGPDFEVVFEAAGERYYCFLHGTESLLEALGLFFKDNPNITYDMIVEHMEV